MNGEKKGKLIQLDPIGESAPDFSRITYYRLGFFFLQNLILKSIHTPERKKGVSAFIIKASDLFKSRNIWYV
jgi:hypothetical protein